MLWHLSQERGRRDAQASRHGKVAPSSASSAPASADRIRQGRLPFLGRVHGSLTLSSLGSLQPGEGTSTNTFILHFSGARENDFYS